VAEVKQSDSTNQIANLSRALFGLNFRKIEKRLTFSAKSPVRQSPALLTHDLLSSPQKGTNQLLNHRRWERGDAAKQNLE